jgi:hypothetical protein
VCSEREGEREREREREKREEDLLQSDEEYAAAANAASSDPLEFSLGFGLGIS